MRKKTKRIRNCFIVHSMKKSSTKTLIIVTSIKFNHLSFSFFVVSVDSMIPFGEISVPQQKRKVKYLAIIEFGFRRIRRILQNKEGVIHRGRRPRWIIPSEICRVLHILRKPNFINCLLFIQNISPFLKEFRHFALCFFRSLKIT